jgi:tetratricopeptide (TPR) repeat protein
MKAEHRKELHTNLLADRMGRLVQGVRSGPRSASLGVWIIGLLALATLVGWYYARDHRDSQGPAWVQMDKTLDSTEDKNLGTSAELDAEQTLQKIIINNPGTLAGRTARFQKARIELNRGLKSLFGPNRTPAVGDLEEARTAFERLIAECQGDNLLEPEALMGAAKAEEALVGVPKKTGEAESSLGDLDRALKWYDRVAKAYPNSFLGQEAEKHAKELRDNRQQVARFYAEINKLGAARPAPAGLPPPTP